jgi:hypothetical protein
VHFGGKRTLKWVFDIPEIRTCVARLEQGQQSLLVPTNVGAACNSTDQSDTTNESSP